MKMLSELAEQGYTVIMTAVHASRVKCLQSGLSREIKEGKQYHSTYWERSIKKIESAFNRCREMGFEDRTFFVFDNTDFTSTLKHVVMPRVGLNVDIRKADKNATVHPVGVRHDDERATFSSTRMPYITPQFTEDLHVQWNRNGESHDFHAAFGDENDSHRSSRSDTTDSLRSFDTVMEEEEKDE